MTLCGLCGKGNTGAAGPITGGICESCALQLSLAPHDRDLLEAIDAPVLLTQGNPRRVVTANNKALALFAKDLGGVEEHRGGEVFDCVHSFTEAGCGKDVNCEDCRIKNAIVDTFVTAVPNNASTSLQIKRPDGLKTYALQVSTEKVGDMAVVRIDRYQEA